MDKGTTLYYRFSAARPIGDVLGRIDNCLRGNHLKPRPIQKGFSIYYQHGETIAFVKGIEELLADLPFEVVQIGMYYESNDGRRKHSFCCDRPFLHETTLDGFQLDLEISDFWPEFLSLDFFPAGSLEDNLQDYRLAKVLFQTLGADICIGSALGEYFSFTDPSADKVLRFTKEGPQRLVRPLEEGRMPITNEHDPKNNDFLLDPATGRPRWAMVVDKPFAELKK